MMDKEGFKKSRERTDKLRELRNHKDSQLFWNAAINKGDSADVISSKKRIYNANLPENFRMEIGNE